ncbi:helix-turn-helix transcriptional regulator [Arthrobacter sp. zg-Y1219]|uniref:helix-turn-helix domain-containing protein n=1 Tax=Arthrobacter sp. zg-Y1219 TaxID=3049067 RepID=UPI0024C30F2F|nr:helix-turn-helix transcriptional regulator [Arthrobacter sp. zg-Y1219]MDK1361309.1 helix-turn-helix transcriptional regulator [Arthrobacter sp. zg-Y1219]
MNKSDSTDGSRQVFDNDAMSEIGRGHLSSPSDKSFTIHRYAPAPPSGRWLRAFWIPVWHVPRGEVREQRILTYPVCLLSITAGYARLVGPTTTAARVPLSGTGWAFGVMLTPSTGRAVLAEDIAGLTNRHTELEAIPLLADLVPLIRDRMSPDPALPSAHAAARRLIEERFAALPRPAGAALLIDRLVARVEHDAAITSVRSLCEVFGLRERTLQRLCARFLGVSPLWLIRQRRLQEAGAVLRLSDGSLGDLASRLGYADQAHFSRDFRRATGWTPGEFAALARPRSSSTGP